MPQQNTLPVTEKEVRQGALAGSCLVRAFGFFIIHLTDRRHPDAGLPAAMQMPVHRCQHKCVVFPDHQCKLPFFFDLGLFSFNGLVMSLILVPVIPIGVMLGKWLNRRINDRIFYHFAHAALMLLGLRLVVGY